MTWIVPIVVFFTSIIGWQYFVGVRTVKPGQCYVQYMDDAIFNCLLQVNRHLPPLCYICILLSTGLDYVFDYLIHCWLLTGKDVSSYWTL